MYYTLILFSFCSLFGATQVGIDRFDAKAWKGKRVGLITNHTGINSKRETTLDVMREQTNLVAIFAPEHGLTGQAHASEKVKTVLGKTPIYSLHGSTRRPNDAMLKEVDVLFYDIQDIGVRSYTYATTLFYAMEECAKRKIPLVVLDRPNPINGVVVDGPMLIDSWRSFLGYLNIPYCHGMTIGELALYFNGEYKVGCDLTIIEMQGWKRSMRFEDTGLPWIPTSPQIPEADTPIFYASTGILGELGIVNIGIGFTLPFKLIGAPWINAVEFAKKLNDQNLPGVHFMPFYYKPFFGSLKGTNCEGVMIQVTDQQVYKPLSVQYMILGILKSLYPHSFAKQLKRITRSQRKLFCQVSGNDMMFTLLEKEPYVAWKLIEFQKEDREQFLKTRAKYLLYD